MASNKNKSVQTNTPGWSTPPPTADTNALRDMVGKTDFATPIRAGYGRAEQNLSRSYLNPLGAYTTADVRDKTLRAAHQEMNQQMGLDLANASMQNQQNAFGQQATIASLTQPRFYNQTSSVSQPWTTGDSLGLATSVAGGLLS